MPVEVSEEVYVDVECLQGLCFSETLVAVEERSSWEMARLRVVRQISRRGLVVLLVCVSIGFLVPVFLIDFSLLSGIWRV